MNDEPFGTAPHAKCDRWCSAWDERRARRYERSAHAQRMACTGAEAPAQVEPRAIVKDHFRTALEQRVHLGDAVDIDHDAAMDAEKARGIERRQQPRQRFAVQVRRTGGMDA